MIVGIDDTDSVDGGCTTYIAAILCEELGVEEPPRLIRLNPNIPYRTRGNGAVAFKTNRKGKKTKEKILSLVKKLARLECENTNPGVVFVESLPRNGKKKLAEFYLKTVSSEMGLEEAEDLAKELDIESHKFNNGRGLIGALAAAGSVLEDPSFEFIAYRAEENYGKKKKITPESIREMDNRSPGTFNNLDPETGQILIIPKGKDPVLCGIRGWSEEAVRSAWKILEVSEPVERTCVFSSNQGTDIHLRPRKISELKPYDCAILEGEVDKDPQTIAGGHVLFALSDGSGRIACAAYEPTGDFRQHIRKLRCGDKVKAYGGIGQYPTTLNLEKLEVVSLAKIEERQPPVCCGKKMTSAGKGKGYKCKSCGKRVREEKHAEIERGISPGIYYVPPRAMRHLSRPPGI